MNLLSFLNVLQLFTMVINFNFSRPILKKSFIVLLVLFSEFIFLKKQKLNSLDNRKIKVLEVFLQKKNISIIFNFF